MTIQGHASPTRSPVETAPACNACGHTHQPCLMPPGVWLRSSQLTSPGGRQPNMLGHATNDGYWKLVRKGTAPAFNPQHIR